MKKILLLEDDIALQEIMKDYLVDRGYEVDGYSDGATALDSIMERKYDILLLDIRVPEISGFELLAYLREIKNSTAVIFITSLSDVENLQKGFDLGANDYLKKPFDLEELHARVKYQLDALSSKDVLTIGNFLFYPKDLYLTVGTKKIHIKHKEAQILLYFLRTNEAIVSLDELIENIWSGENPPTYATIRTYIKNLRKVLGSEAIENIKGQGYRLSRSQ